MSCLVDPVMKQQKFLKAIKEMDPGIHEQVYSLRDVEEEPYTICRWLRATKFKADDILNRIKENQPIFEAAREKDFYPGRTRNEKCMHFTFYISLTLVFQLVF